MGFNRAPLGTHLTATLHLIDSYGGSPNFFSIWSTPVLISEIEARRALDGLNPNTVAGPDGLFPKVLKTLNSPIAPVLARMLNCSLQTAQVPGNSDPSASRLSFAKSLRRSSEKSFYLTYPNIRY